MTTHDTVPNHYDIPTANGDQDITVVTGRRACRACNYVNQAGNEYCVHCGSPLGNVPELVHDTSRAAESRASWRRFGIETEMVGREAELEHLTDRFREVVESQQVAAVMLNGPEGIGKSRLIEEFSRVINTRFGDALLISGVFRSAADRAYSIVDRLLRSRFYIPEQLPEDLARERLLEGVRAIVKTPVALEIAHRIGQLIELPFPDSPFDGEEQETPEAAREAAWRALANLFRADAAANPLVVVLEDLHFATTEALELIPFLARELVDAPIMCVISSSAEFAEERAEVLRRFAEVEQVALRPLSDDDIRRLVDQILTRATEIPRLLYERVCTNAMGNPLVAEEILRIFIAEGAIDTLEGTWRVNEEAIEHIEVPSELSSVLQAGIERLSDAERRLLEQAAVVGDHFWVTPLTILARNLGPVGNEGYPWNQTARGEDEILELLARLIEHDLIRQREEARYPNEIEYAFTHAAVRQSLLDNLDGELEAHIHGLVAQWHELNRASGIRELEEVIAFHHEWAGHPHRAGYGYLRAADAARDAHQNRRALKLYRKALELLDDSQLMLRMHALHELGGVYDLVGDYEAAIQPLGEMLRLAWRLASLGKGGAAHNKLGRAYRSLGYLEQAMEHFDHAMNLFRRANDRVGISSTLDDIGKVHWIKGAYRAALEHYKEALAIRRELGDLRSLALSHNHLGTLMVHQGDFKEALVHLREALSLRKKIGDQRGVADSLNNLGVMLAERGDLDDALRLWAESQEVARQIGDRRLEGILLNNMGEITCHLGRLDEAEEYLNAAAQICEECAERRLLFDVIRNLGLLELKRHETARAIAYLEKSLEMAKALDSLVLEGIALRCLGEGYGHRITTDDAADQHLGHAERAFQRAIAILEEVGNDAELGRSHLAYGRFLIEQGLFVRAKNQLEPAVEIFGRLGMKPLLEQAQHLVEDL